MLTYNKQSTFFIYDYETFGLNPSSDRPAQFAGIRVNHALCPIEKKFLFCQIPNDYLPDPESVLITGITPQYTLKYGLKESEFAHHISKIFNVPNTCIMGYNNVRFDDEFSRHIFYRNFIDPYLWSYNNGNSRWDILPVIKAFYVLCPNKIKWPINKKNKISFKLNDLTYANSIRHPNAHDAMSDVLATLEIMKLLHKKEPELFHFLYNYRTKNQIKKIIKFDLIYPLIFISNNINNTCNNFIKLLLPISWHPTNCNVLITYDLDGIFDNLSELNINELYHNLISNIENIQDLFKKIPLQLIKLNSCPILIPINLIKKYFSLNYCNPELILWYKNTTKKINLIQQKIKCNCIRKKINMFYKTIEYYLKNQKKYLNNHVDNKLYNGFFNFQDQQIIKTIRKTSTAELSKIKINSNDIRLKSLLFFYKARNFPYSLDNNEQKKWIIYKNKLIFNSKKYENYAETIEKLIFSHQKNSKKIKLLNNLKIYYQNFCNAVSNI